jgi:hypothetical protein
MAAEFRDASKKTVDVITDSDGGLVENREDLGIVAEWNPAILNTKTHLLNPRHWYVQIAEGYLIPSGI